MKRLKRIASVALALVLVLALLPIGTQAAGSAPGKVTVTKVQYTSRTIVKVSWKKVNAAAGYQIQTAVNGGGWKTAKHTAQQSVTLPKKATSTVKLRVRAYVKAGSQKVYGAWSKTYTVKAYKSYSSKPGRVAGVAASGSKITQLTLSWKAVTNATGYQVYRANRSGGPYTRIATVKGTSFTDKTVRKQQNETKSYFYKVRAYRNTGGKTRYGAFSPVKKAGWVVTQKGGSVSEEVILYDTRQYCNGCGADITGIGSYAHMKSRTIEELMEGDCGGSTFVTTPVGREWKTTDRPEKGYWK